MSKAPQLAEARQWLEDVKLPQTLAVAWSGGVDSTALLLALHGQGYKVHAWHIDHAWHAASAAHGRHLQQQAKAWGIPFYAASVNMAPAANREAEARRARMNQFESWAGEQGIEVLCLAHHLEDQAETVCLRMLQGAGVSGCCGMAAMRRQGGLMLMRPLLHVQKHALEVALQRVGVDWLTDPSNKDVSLLRNRIRHTLFPAIRKADIDPVGLFMRWQRQATVLSERLQALADNVEVRKQADRVFADWAEWCGQPRRCARRGAAAYGRRVDGCRHRSGSPAYPAHRAVAGKGGQRGIGPVPLPYCPPTRELESFAPAGKSALNIDPVFSSEIHIPGLRSLRSSGKADVCIKAAGSLFEVR